jgi:hypothetical protein
MMACLYLIIRTRALYHDLIVCHLKNSFSVLSMILVMVAVSLMRRRVFLGSQALPAWWFLAADVWLDIRYKYVT